MFSVTLGGIVGIILFGYTYLLFTYLIGKAFKCYPYMIKVLEWEGCKRSEKEKRKWVKTGKFRLTPVIALATGKNKSVREEYILGYGPMVVNFLFYFIFVITLRIIYGSAMNSEGIGFFSGIVEFGAAISAFVVILALISDCNKDNKELMKLLREQRAKLMDGTYYSELDVYEGLAMSGRGAKHLRVAHLNMCINKALDRGDYQILPKYMKHMDELLMTANGYNTSMTNYTGCYYNLLFYSSYIFINVQNAFKMYSLIKDRIESDEDPNAKRILAFYQYFIMGRPDLAASSAYRAEKAMENVNMDMYSEAELNLDRKFLRELRNRMASDSKVNSTERPIMEYNQ